MANNFDRELLLWYSRNSIVEERSALNVFFVNVKSIFTIKFLFSCVLNATTSRLCSSAVKTVVKFQKVPFRKNCLALLYNGQDIRRALIGYELFRKRNGHCIIPWTTWRSFKAFFLSVLILAPTHAALWTSNIHWYRFMPFHVCRASLMFLYWRKPVIRRSLLGQRPIAGYTDNKIRRTFHEFVAVKEALLWMAILKTFAR